jgi:hypothetical protein
MARGRPKYPPEEVVRLAEEGRIVGTQDARDGLSNHDYDEETLGGVVGAITSCGRFKKQLLLREGPIADVYNVAVLDADWYLKFYVDEADDGGELIVVVSCKWWSR